MIFSLPSGRDGPSPSTTMNIVEIFLLETFVLHIGFRIPSDAFSTMYLYWEQIVAKNYYGIEFSRYVAVVFFLDFNNFRNVGVAQVVVAIIKIQEELFRL